VKYEDLRGSFSIALASFTNLLKKQGADRRSAGRYFLIPLKNKNHGALLSPSYLTIAPTFTRSYVNCTRYRRYMLDPIPSRVFLLYRSGHVELRFERRFLTDAEWFASVWVNSFLTAVESPQFFFVSLAQVYYARFILVWGIHGSLTFLHTKRALSHESALSIFLPLI
jgi:hypothetical protein